MVQIITNNLNNTNEHKRHNKKTYRITKLGYQSTKLRRLERQIEIKLYFNSGNPLDFLVEWESTRQSPFDIYVEWAAGTTQKTIKSHAKYQQKHGRAQQMRQVGYKSEPRDPNK